MVLSTRVETPTSADHLGDEAQPDALPVLFMLASADAMNVVRAHLAEGNEYLRAWAARAAENGFVLGKPLAGAWLVSGPGLEEYSPKNELVNRLTRLVLLQRYGRLPRWLSEGLAWQAENELLGSVYCFPRRNGFVFCTEHTGWGTVVQRRFAHAKEGIALPDLARIRFDGEFSLTDSQCAWVASEFLVREHPDAIAPLLLALARDRDAHHRRDLGGGRWELIPDYESPLEVQAACFEEGIGPGVWTEVTEFVRKGAKASRR